MTRKSLVKAADRAFSQYIVARDKKCVCCGSTRNLQCGHLFSRIAYSTRWNSLNSACQCARCNMNHEGDALPFMDYMVAKHGRDKIDELHTLYHQPIKYKDYQLEEIARFYREKFAMLVETK
jgi:hypothetical protein